MSVAGQHPHRQVIDVVDTIRRRMARTEEPIPIAARKCNLFSGVVLLRNS
jgi:hypothetical protein